MNNNTRLKFSALTLAMAATYGVPDVSKQFVAAPTLEQELMDKIVQSADFLGQINILGVRDTDAEKILGSVNALVGKRTDTSGAGERVTTSVLNLEDGGYSCKKTEYDVNITYDQLDAWSKFPDFNERFLTYVRRAIALGRIKVGFYGESFAVDTDAGANPNGEDVNAGWFEHLRNAAEPSVILQGATANQIRLGVDAGNDYPNLDAMVFDILQLVDETHRDRGDLVALIGRDLLATDKSQLYVNQGATPTEKERIETASVTRTYGGLPSMMVPNFPARGVMVTPLSNLSIYYQEGSVRQKINENSAKDRVDYFNMIRDAYVIEDTAAAAAVEFKNVKFWDGLAWS